MHMLCIVKRVVNFGWGLSRQESLMPAEMDHNYCKDHPQWDRTDLERSLQGEV